jgi:hypothetical protein
VARAIAEGIGAGASAVTTDEVSPEEIAAADLVVAGSPVIGFSMPSERAIAGIAREEADAPQPPDLSHPSLRSLLDTLPSGKGKFAAFETRIWWSPRGATGEIERRLKGAGYSRAAKAEKFVVNGKYGPLREGELERARQWGHNLAKAVAAP